MPKQTVYDTAYLDKLEEGFWETFLAIRDSYAPSHGGVFFDSEAARFDRILDGLEKTQVLGRAIRDLLRLQEERNARTSTPSLFSSALWEVYVGNVGNVYRGSSEEDARREWEEYVEISKSDQGRAGGEEVNLFRGGDLVETYSPPMEELPPTPGINLGAFGTPKRGEARVTVVEEPPVVIVDPDTIRYTAVALVLESGRRITLSEVMKQLPKGTSRSTVSSALTWGIKSGLLLWRGKGVYSPTPASLAPSIQFRERDA